jgi:hypothetical protein
MRCMFSRTDISRQFRAQFTVRNGSITQAEFELGHSLEAQDESVGMDLIHTKMHEIESWTGLLPDASVGRFMDGLLGSGGSLAGIRKDHRANE